MPLLKKIVSGGQAGVDRAALDYAISVGLPHGGKVPQGYGAEDGTIDRQKYSGLVETKEADPDFRTEQNVRESDGTLIITKGSPDRGTALTITLAEEFKKPHKVIDLSRMSLPNAVAEVRSFLSEFHIAVLNVAGPRESQVEGEGIYHQAFGLLAVALALETTTYTPADVIHVACHLHGEAQANFRHWDTIRWNSVGWVCTLVIAAATIVGLVSPKSPKLLALVFACCGLTAIVEFLLLWNLTKYHRAAIRDSRQNVENLLGIGPISDALRKDLPFSFDTGGWRTATAWLRVFVGLAALISVLTAIRMLLRGE